MSVAPRSIAYLISQYPALSMIFIIREVLQLKRLGFRIDTASINAADRSGKGLTADEAGEAALTYYIKPHGVPGALAAHADGLMRHPAGYLRGLKRVFSLAGLDIKRVFMNLMYFTEALMVGRWMRAKGHDHLHTHLGSQATTVGLFVKTIFGYGLSTTIHGPDEFYDADRQYLTQKVIAADFMVCISHFARSQMMKLSPYEHWGKFVVSRLGIDPRVFAPRPARAQPEVFEVLCVGRLTPAKGQHQLVEAIADMVRDGRRVRLRLVGAGVDRESLEKHVAELGMQSHVIFEGAVNQDRIRDLYAQADAFCIPSFAEGIPVVLMEAMAMEIPVVSTHITGIPELIRTGIDGLLVAPSDQDGLVQALSSLMDDPEKRLAMGRQGRQRVLAHYDLAANVERLAEIFSQRLAHQR